MIESRDQLNTLHRFAKVPERIVSLVPSITELLCDLGLEDRMVGCTKFCVHPRHLRSRQNNIGGTKNPRLDKIRDLEPDIILANKEENRLEDVAWLRDVAPVWVSDVPSLEAGEDLIQRLAELFDAGDLGKKIMHTNRASLAELGLPQRKSALYLIWREPFMGAGRDTFIHDVMNRLGFDNVLANRTRYPEVETRELEDLAPQLILLSSEPYPFKTTHLEEMRKLFPRTEIRLVNGEYFSWYGSRIGHLESIYVSG